MGELKEQPKNETEKKPDGESAPKKDDAPSPVVVYKLDLHCEGCIKKIKRTARHFNGVETVKADLATNKVTVTGKMDPAQLQTKLAEKTKKKVDLISPQPKKEEAAGEKPPEKKPEEKKPEEKKPEEKKPEEKKPEETKPKETTVVLKIRLHCDGCITKIRRIILKFKGVETVNLDGEKDLVTVKGTMSEKELVEYLKDKLKRNVDVVALAPKKEEEKKEKEKEKDGGGEKKEEKKEGGGEKKVEGGADTKAVEVNKMEYQYPIQAPPMYWFDGHAPGQSSYSMESQPNSHHYVEPSGYMNMNMNHNQGYPPPMHMNQQGYPMMQPPPPFYMHPQLPPPQMFSDENPNACSLM